MKLKDVKVGMIVVDKYDNKYIVTEVVTEVNETESSGNRAMPVRLKSVEIVRNVHVSQLKFDVIIDVTFSCAGQVYWIYKSKKHAKRDGFFEEDIITVKSLKPKYEVISADQSRTPVQLRCTKINSICRVEETSVFYDVDDEWWNETHVDRF